MYLAVASSGVCETVVGSALEVGGCLISMRLMWRAAAASVNIFGAMVPLSTPGMALYGGGSLGCEFDFRLNDSVEFRFNASSLARFSARAWIRRRASAWSHRPRPCRLQRRVETSLLCRLFLMPDHLIALDPQPGHSSRMYDPFILWYLPHLRTHHARPLLAMSWIRTRVSVSGLSVPLDDFLTL